MSSTAWVFQKAPDVEKVGESKAPWYTGWYDLTGKRRAKSHGPGVRGKDRAERHRRDVERDHERGVDQANLRMTWETFREQYRDRILAGLAVKTRHEATVSLNHFERIAKPGKVGAIATCTVDAFIAARRQEPGKKPGSLLSPASINKDLRHLKAALRVAKEWRYLQVVPKIRMERVVKGLPLYVTGDHFGLIYGACDAARFPEDQPFPAADWWRALLAMGYLTGWRIGDMLGLRRGDLDLDTGTAVTRGDVNKGKRDERIKLHAVVIDHLRKIPSFDPCVFPWNHDRRTLDSEFLRIQKAAKIDLPCKTRGPHEHTPYCFVYGFHDLRRAFATMNADKLTPDALQALMRHKSYQTTQVYINMARQMDAAVASLHVPDVLKKGTGTDGGTRP